MYIAKCINKTISRDLNHPTNISLYFALSWGIVEIAILIPTYIIIMLSAIITRFLKDTYHVATVFLIIPTTLSSATESPPALSEKKLISKIGILLKITSSIVYTSSSSSVPA